MNDDDITWNIITYSKNLMLVLCFAIILYIIWTYQYTKYLMFAVLDKTEFIIYEFIIYESNIFFWFFSKFPEIFREIFFPKIDITTEASATHPNIP